MLALAICLGTVVALLLCFLPLILSGKEWAAAQEKARARRLADAKMNARLLRMNL
jgi:hypothetical protein